MTSVAFQCPDRQRRQMSAGMMFSLPPAIILPVFIGLWVLIKYVEFRCRSPFSLSLCLKSEQDEKEKTWLSRVLGGQDRSE